MGLDSVEILVEVEKALEIEISNAEASNIYTVGDFQNCAWKHIQNKRPLANKCFSQITFYKLRPKFIELLHIDKSAFSPDQKIEHIFPKKNRRELWSVIQNSVDLKLPDLELISPFQTVLTVFGFVAIIGGLVISIVLYNVLDLSALIFLIPIFGGLLTFFLSSLFTPYRLKFIDNTIRELTERTLAMNFVAVTSNEGISKKDVDLLIIQIISDKAGIDMRDITKEKSITKDLGID